MFSTSANVVLKNSGAAVGISNIWIIEDVNIYGKIKNKNRKTCFIVSCVLMQNS